MAVASWCVLGCVPAAAAGGHGAGAFQPRTVQVHRTRLPGPGGHGAPGPVAVTATFAHPTRAGDLLVAAVVDGVRSSGMRQPVWQPRGWRTAGEVIGGNTAGGGTGGYRTGGLQAAIYYLPDNPGGVTTVRLGSVPAGTDANVTTVVAEIAGIPHRLAVVGRGSSTSGPSPATDTTTSTVSLDGRLGTSPALVLAAFTNGGTAPYGERWVHPARWRVVGEDPSRHDIDEPLLLDETVWRARGVPRQSIAYRGGGPIDNCALMVALGAPGAGAPGHDGTRRSGERGKGR